MNTKHTPLKARVSKHDALKDVYHVDTGPEGYERIRVAIVEGREGRQHADLFAEALTVTHETGLTPRRLAEERAELIAVLKDCSESLARLQDSEGAYRVTCLTQANALLAKVKGTR